MTQPILSFVTEQLKHGNPVALLTVTQTRGSSPASVGQCMAVLPDGTTKGTIGGGASEFDLAQQAIGAMQNHERVFTFSHDHAKSGMVCGGSMDGYGTIFGNENRLVLFGGGHIAQALAPMASQCGFCVTVVEDRAEFAPYFDAAGIDYVLSTPEEYQQKVSMNGSVYATICTRGHKTDLEALRFCLSNAKHTTAGEAAYIGMIGSKHKVLKIFHALQQEGVPPIVLERVYAPIGLDIASEIPAEIAVSILAQILLIKNSGILAHRHG